VTFFPRPLPGYLSQNFSFPLFFLSAGEFPPSTFEPLHSFPRANTFEWPFFFRFLPLPIPACRCVDSLCFLFQEFTLPFERYALFLMKSVFSGRTQSPFSFFCLFLLSQTSPFLRPCALPAVKDVFLRDFLHPDCSFFPSTPFSPLLHEHEGSESPC